MEVNVYAFPTVKDGPKMIEEAYVSLLVKYRNGDSLPPEVLDWMDFANNYLQTSEG